MDLDSLPRDLRCRRSLPAPPAPAPPRLGPWLRRTGPRPVAALGLVTLLVWAATGSAVLGLRTAGTSGAAGAAGLWLAGITVIAGVTAVAVLFAARVGSSSDEDHRRARRR